MAVTAVLLAAPCQAQLNLDARKSPAEIFADNCGVCHKSPAALKRTNAVFLRRHYSTGPAQASAMAAYLANLPPEPRNPPQPTEARQQSGESRTLSAGESIGPI